MFVHARRHTVLLASHIRETLLEKKQEGLFQDETFLDQIGKCVKRLSSKELQELALYGIAFHHAGMLRTDRNAVEGLFRSKALRVLVCTATLAWGVNLPAHTVIIHGTEIYDARRGGYVHLSALDVTQIFGRAGRPQYDTTGHGIIITSEREIHQYLRLLAHSLPIESRLHRSLPDHLNAEIHAGTVGNIPEAVQWLEYTYFWQRLQKNPLRYGVNISDLRRDRDLTKYRYELMSGAAKQLAKSRMIRYSEDTGKVDCTEVGRIASYLYLSYSSIDIFNNLLSQFELENKAFVEEGDVFNVIACSIEFSQIRVRIEEEVDLQKMYSQLPASVRRISVRRESADDSTSQWKVVLLMKCYISRLVPSEHSIASDMTYITQNAGRVARGLYEIEAHKGHPHTALLFFNIVKSLERKCWEDIDHPLRQYEKVPLTQSVIRYLDQRRPSIEDLIAMGSNDIGDLIHNRRLGAVVKQMALHFPAVAASVEVFPITRTVLRLKITITPNFVWSTQYHDATDNWWLTVSDDQCETILHQETVRFNIHDVIKAKSMYVNCTIPVHPENERFLVSMHNERWVGASEVVPFTLSRLVLPDDKTIRTKLLKLRPIGVYVLSSRLQKLYDFAFFNSIQTQCFHAFYHQNDNIFLGAPTGSGKTVCAELAMIQLLQSPKLHRGKIVYIAPLKALVRERLKDWSARFEKKCRFSVIELTGDKTPDLAAIHSADIICTTPEKWDGITRSWKSRQYTTAVRLVIFDEIHMLGGDRGPILEVLVSRLRYISWHQKSNIRLIGLSTAVANPTDMALWLGIARPNQIFNFDPSVRPAPMRCHVAGFPGVHYCPRMSRMNKPTYEAIVEKSPTKPVLVFVSSRRQTRLTSMALINHMLQEGKNTLFLRMNSNELRAAVGRAQDSYLQHGLQFGVGMHHAGLLESDRILVEMLFRSGKLQILVCTSTLAWGVNFPAYLVVIKGTEYYDAKTKSYIDFPITDILQMMGRAGRPQFDKEGIAQIFVAESKKTFYKRFLYEPFPVESSLHECLSVHFNAEIVAGIICTSEDAVDYLTWTYLFRRLLRNPRYYGLQESNPENVTNYLADLVRSIFNELENSFCICMADSTEQAPSRYTLAHVSPTLLGKLCSYYYLHYRTGSLFETNCQADTSRMSIIEIVSKSEEFKDFPLRHNEDARNAELAEAMNLTKENCAYDSPHMKVYLLLLAHIQRITLPIADYYTDTRTMLENLVRIMQAMVDICAKNGLLFTAIRVMNIMQSVVQAQTWKSSSLLQVPHIKKEILSNLKVEGITEICQLANGTSAEKRIVRSILSKRTYKLSSEQIDESMEVINRLPLLEVFLKSDTQVDDGVCTVTLDVTLFRLTPTHPHVHAPHYPRKKDEQFWAIVGCDQTGELIALKHVHRIRRRRHFQLVFDWDESWDQTFVIGDELIHKYRLYFYLISDSYIGLDLQYGFEVTRLS